MGIEPASDAAHLSDRARLGAGRVMDELERAERDLSRAWPRVAPEVIEEGRAAVARTQAALRDVMDRLGEPPQQQLGLNDTSND